MSLAPFDFQLRTRICFGLGMVKSTADHLASLAPNIQQVLLVTDKGVRDAGLVRQVSGPMQKAGLDIQIFDRVGSDPKASAIDETAELIRDYKPQAVLGLGGGSPMDAAKLAACAAGSRHGCLHYACCANHMPRRSLSLVMIPTTAGTGAEVTRSTVFSTEKGNKLWAYDSGLAPDLAILDPELTLGLPPGLTASTGLDALVHAVEAATVRRSHHMSRTFGLEAIRLAGCGLKTVLQTPDDPEARGKMLLAACLAGLAIDQAGTGLSHAFGHALGSLAGIHHGTAVAWAEQVVLPFNCSSEAELHAEIVRLLGGGECTEAELPAMASQTWAELMKMCGLDQPVIRTRLAAMDAATLADTCLNAENISMVKNNCRKAERQDLIEMAESLLKA
jgi:alcohol dehydrogenase class IV